MNELIYDSPEDDPDKGKYKDLEPEEDRSPVPEKK